jgi:plastocyanin
VRRLWRAVPIVLLVGLVFPADALAASPRVIMLNFVFTPDPAKPHLGDQVTWWNEPHNRQFHTTTDTDPLLLWDSGELNSGEKFTYTFTAAGSYSYECTLHIQFGMMGSIGVRNLVSPPSGPVGTVFTVTAATIEAPTGMGYDIQKREPGGRFQTWVSGASSPTAQFDSAGQPTGSYGFRSRLRRLSDNAAIGYSPVGWIDVTG